MRILACGVQGRPSGQTTVSVRLERTQRALCIQRGEHRLQNGTFKFWILIFLISRRRLGLISLFISSIILLLEKDAKLPFFVCKRRPTLDAAAFTKCPTMQCLYDYSFPYPPSSQYFADSSIGSPPALSKARSPFTALCNPAIGLYMCMRSFWKP